MFLAIMLYIVHCPLILEQKMILEQGKGVGFILLLLILAIFAWTNKLAKDGKVFKIRKLAPLEAIDEAVGRSVELGRPVHFTPGYNLGGLYTKRAPEMLAGLTLLSYVSRVCARKGAEIIVTINPPEAMPIAEENVRIGFIMEGKEPPVGAVRWISTEQYAFAIGVLTIIQEEKPGANFLMGAFWSEALQFAMAGNYVGAIGIAGAVGQLPMFLAAMDYVLIGEELFAAQAYVSEDPIKIASIAGQDWNRILLMAITTATFLLSNMGFDVMSILTM